MEKSTSTSVHGENFEVNVRASLQLEPYYIDSREDQSAKQFPHGRGRIRVQSVHESSNFKQPDIKVGTRTPLQLEFLYPLDYRRCGSVSTSLYYSVIVYELSEIWQS